MNKILFTASCIIASCLSTPSSASSLCVQVTGMPLQCLYEDATSCQREASRLGGTCALNPTSPPTTTGSFNSLYCVVKSATIATCIYPDRASCDLEATRRQGACVANLPEPYSDDPYKIKRPYY